jgi:integrase
MSRVSVNGGRKYFYGATRKEVADQMAAALHDAQQGVMPVDERQTVKQYLNTWYEMKRSQLKASSLRPYRNDIAIRLIPQLGRIPLAKLTAQDIQLAYSRLIDAGSSPKTVYDAHGVLHTALEDAVRMGLVVRNVADMVHPPRKQQPEMHIFTTDEITRFLTQVQGDRFEALYLLAFTSGAREGELLGLRWQDIDFPGRTIQIRVAVQETDDDRFTLAEPKTAYSRRTIPLPEATMQALAEHWKRQVQGSELMGDKWNDTLNLVFPNGYGTIMIPHNITKRSFKRHLVAIGMPRDVRFHDIRHTHATQLLALGVNVKVVSERLGHADVATTLRTYAHVLPHMQGSAVAAAASMLASYEPRKLETDALTLVSGLVSGDE